MPSGLFGATVPPLAPKVPVMSFSVSPAGPADRDAVEALIDESFGRGRHERTVYRFREARAPWPGLAYVARGADGALLGAIDFWPVLLPDGTRVPLLGPLAVMPSLRGFGIGRTLVSHGLSAARLSGAEAVLIVGDPGYYAPYGFTVDMVAGLTLPGPVAPLAFMGLEWRPGLLSAQKGPVDAVAPTRP